MKKFLLTLGVMLSSLTMSAQLVFVDANGKELANNATITMNKAEMNEWDEFQVALEGISIKNTSSSAQTFNMDVEVKDLANGSFACCFGETCKNAMKATTISLKDLSIKGSTTVAITNTEWVIDAEGQYGTTKVAFKLSTGNTLNVNFVYADPASIYAASEGKKIAGIFDMTGKSIKAMQKGINIVRFTDGTVKKHIVK